MTTLAPSAVDSREQIVARAVSDPAFRQQLLANPKRTLEQTLGVTFPPSLEVVVLEETASRICLVVPRLAPASEELTDEQLTAVAGGSLPIPIPRPVAMPEPMPTPTMLISSLYLNVRR